MHDGAFWPAPHRKQNLRKPWRRKKRHDCARESASRRAHAKPHDCAFVHDWLLGVRPLADILRQRLSPRSVNLLAVILGVRLSPRSLAAVLLDAKEVQHIMDSWPVQQGNPYCKQGTPPRSPFFSHQARESPWHQAIM